MAFWNLVVGQKEDKEILENAERMKENISNHKGGVFRILLPGYKRYYLAYEPLERRGWTAVTIVSADLFSGFSDSYVVKMMGNLVVVMLVFGAYFSCCLKATARGKRNWNTWLFPMR
ncbi:MAG: hypothetical protein ACLUB0_13280 [Blautia hansenii]